MSSSAEWMERILSAKHFVEQTDPDFVSIQYEHFSFHVKGLPIFIPNYFRKICGSKPVQIMFHELWIGMIKNSSVKSVLWGKLQQRILRQLIHKTNPFVIHSQSTVYKAALEQLNIPVKFLPLFSNLTVLYPEKIANKVAGPPQNNHTIHIVSFGSIYTGAMLGEFSNAMKNYSVSHNVCFKLIVIGKPDVRQHQLVQAWLSTGMEIDVLGQLDDAAVSGVLTDIHYGIFTTPLAIVEKSSAVATMRAHGIQLLCIAPRMAFRNGYKPGDPSPHFLQFEAGCLHDFFNAGPSSSAVPGITNVCEQFTKDVSGFSKEVI